MGNAPALKTQRPAKGGRDRPRTSANAAGPDCSGPATGTLGDARSGTPGDRTQRPGTRQQRTVPSTVIAPAVLFRPEQNASIVPALGRYRPLMAKLA